MAEFKERLERRSERIAAERRRILSQAQARRRNRKGARGNPEISWRRRTASVPQSVITYARVSRPNRKTASRQSLRNPIICLIRRLRAGQRSSASCNA